MPLFPSLCSFHFSRGARSVPSLFFTSFDRPPISACTPTHDHFPRTQPRLKKSSPFLTTCTYLSRQSAPASSLISAPFAFAVFLLACLHPCMYHHRHRLSFLFPSPPLHHFDFVSICIILISISPLCIPPHSAFRIPPLCILPSSLIPLYSALYLPPITPYPRLKLSNLILPPLHVIYTPLPHIRSTVLLSYLLTRYELMIYLILLALAFAGRR